MQSTRCGHEAPHLMGCRLLRRINRGWNRAYGSILPSSCPLSPSPLSSVSVFLRDLRPPSTTMVVELPPSWFKMTSSLASLRWLMGWQAPGLACKVKSGATSLANMRLGDFVFFTAYALEGWCHRCPPSSLCWSTTGSSCNIYLPTPSLWWPSSPTSVRCMWGYGHRCGCSGASSC
jgi:hypothetical protein